MLISNGSNFDSTAFEAQHGDSLLCPVEPEEALAQRRYKATLAQRRSRAKRKVNYAFRVPFVSHDLEI